MNCGIQSIVCSHSGARAAAALGLIAAVGALTSCALCGKTATTNEPESIPLIALEPMEPIAVPPPQPEPEPEPVAPVAPPAPALEAFEFTVPGGVQPIAMAPIAAGRVTVAAPDGPRTVEVGPFWMATTEVTWDVYDVFVFEKDRAPGGGGTSAAVDAIARPSRPYVPPDRGYGHAGYAAISVAPKSALAFCAWLSASTGRTFRLATEAEWQLACERSGITAANLDDHAWHKGNADGTPHPVASKQPDASGLYDMYGNVREWCTSLAGEPIAIGGSFREPADEVGCAVRHIPQPEWQESDPQMPKSVWWLSDADFMGLRMVCVPD